MRERCQQLINFLSEVISLVLVITFLSGWEMASPVTGEGGEEGRRGELSAGVLQQPTTSLSAVTFALTSRG